MKIKQNYTNLIYHSFLHSKFIYKKYYKLLFKNRHDDLRRSYEITKPFQVPMIVDFLKKINYP